MAKGLPPLSRIEEGEQICPAQKKNAMEKCVRKIRSPHVRILAALMASIGILALTAWTPAHAQQPGANEVIVYENIDYLGTQRSWKLEPGMRQKLVPYVGDDLNNRISSMRVGSSVGVAAFDDASYGGVYAYYEFSETASKNSTGLDFQSFEDRISSLIIFPKQMKGPLGVSLGHPAANLLNLIPADIKFFPLPEMMNQASAKYPVLGPEWDDVFDFGMIIPEPKSSDYGGYVEVVLYEQANFGGKSITIPWSVPSGALLSLPPIGAEGIFELADLEFVAIASSLEVRWVDTSHAHALAPPAPDTTQAPSDRTPAPPSSGVTGTHISGQWNSNIGAVYEIQQSGNNFTWSAPSLNQSGTGTIAGTSVTMNGPGWTVKGTITETDASGKPTKIVGENGVILFRTTGGPAVPATPPAQQPIPPTPPAPPVAVISLSGQWNSNIGAVYEIHQSGNNFTWSAPGLNQSGTGTISGTNVTMNGPGWTVKGTITETDASGKPIKIVGENGVILFRSSSGKG